MHNEQFHDHASQTEILATHTQGNELNDLLSAFMQVYNVMIHEPVFSQIHTGNNGWQFIPEAVARVAIAKATLAAHAGIPQLPPGLK